MQTIERLLRRIADNMRYVRCFSSWTARAWYLSARAASLLGASSKTVQDLTGRAGGLVNVRGYRFDVRYNSADIAVLHPGHERETREWFQALFNARGRAGVFIDVGAHCGSYAICNESGFDRIIAVEPHPDNFQALTRNIELSRLSDRIQPHQVAVGATTGSGRLFLATDDMHTLLPTQRGVNSIVVRQLTIDDLLAQCGVAPDCVRVLKADIEGAESDLIRGGGGLLTRGHPDLVLEANGEAAVVTLVELLAPHHYRLTRRFDGLNLLFQRN